MKHHELLPPSLVGGLQRYTEQGVPCGHFLTAVLSNDLAEACRRADNDNKSRLWDIVYWLYNYAPASCWGSPEKVQAWISQHRERREENGRE